MAREKEKLRVFGFDAEEFPEFAGKCLECNNSTDVFYALAKNEKEARELVKKGKDGVCGFCMSDRLIEMCQDGYVIIKP